MFSQIIPMVCYIKRIKETNRMIISTDAENAFVNNLTTVHGKALNRLDRKLFPDPIKHLQKACWSHHT